MKLTSFSLGVSLFAMISSAYCQEFVVTQAQINNTTQCQENCTHEEKNGANAVQIDRSGVDKASVHLQIMQQATPRFTEPANAKKSGNDEKKSTSKSQENS